MTQEQKARAYDRAFKEAKAIHNFSSNIAEIKRMEQIFPELAESEDEKVRKALIKYFSEGREYLSLIPYNKEQCVAWLEKQGQVKESIISQHEIETCKENDDSLTSEDEKIRKEIIDFIYDKTDTYELREKSNSWLAWLEKQGEQKPYGQREECLDCQVNYAGECKGSCELKRNEQKPIWSEEDENVLEDIEEAIINYWHGDTQDILLDWLKSLKDRIGE